MVGSKIVKLPRGSGGAALLVPALLEVTHRLKERVVCQSEPEESPNKKLLGQSCHTTGRARL